MVATAQTTTTQVMQLARPQAGTRPVVTKTVVPPTTADQAQYTKIVAQSSAASQRTQSVKVTVKQGSSTASATRTLPVAKPAFRPRPHFAPSPTVVSSVNFGNATVGAVPVTMTLSFPADSVSNGASSVVANGGTAPGSASDYIFFGNQNVEFGQQGGGQPQNLTNFSVSTLNNVEYPGNGNYTKITAPDGTGPFTTGTVTENPTNYPNTTPHTTLLATFSPLNAGSFTVYILDGNTDGVYVGNSTVSLGVNGGQPVATGTRFVSGTNEFTRYNVANASPSDVFQVYATTSTNAYPTIGGLTFTMGTASQSLTAETAAGTDFKVGALNCTGSGCSAQVTFTPGYPGLRYDSVQLTDTLGNLVYQTYLYGVGQAPQFGYEFGNLTIYSGYGGQNPLGVAIGPDEQLYYTSTGSSTIYQFARDFSASNSFNLDGLTTPSGIVVDGTNTLYVADQTNNVVFFRTSGDIQGTVTTSPLSGPSQLAIDGTGALYIADTGNNRVIKIDNQGNETTVASGLNAPSGVAVDDAGDVFIADQANGGEILEYMPGASSAVSFASQIGVTTLNLAVDASGSVFLTSVQQGFQVFRSNGMNESSYATGGDIPQGIALDRNGDILLTNPLKNQFAVFDRTSSNFILNSPPTTSTNGQVTITNTGNMPLTFGTFTTTGPEFTVDPNNNQCASQGTLQTASLCNVQIDFTPPLAQYYTDTMIATSNSLNVPGTQDPFYLAGNGQGAPSTTTLSAVPTAVQAGNSVELLVTVSDAPMDFQPTGQVTFMDGSSVLGTATLTSGAIAGTATANFTTTSLTVGTHSITAVYAGDANVDNGTSGAVTVTVYTGAPPPDGGLAVSSYQFPATNVGGRSFTNLNLDAGAVSVSSISEEFTVGEVECDGPCVARINFYPEFPGVRTGGLLEYDQNGNLVGKILVYGTGTGPELGFDPGSDSLYSGTVGAPGALAYGPDRSLYLADNSTNQVYIAVNSVFEDDQNTTPISVFPIVNLGTIGGIAVDGGNKVYVADQTHNLIVTYDPSLPASQAQSTIPTSPLSSPTGVAVDGAGNLYIADTGHSRIIEIDNQGNETTVTSDAAGVGPLAVDSAGDLYYAITSSSGSVMTISADGGSPTVVASNISGIQGLSVDAANRVYYTNGAGLSILPLPSCGGCPIEGLTLTGFPAQALTGVLVDGAGDIFATQPGTGFFALSVRSGGSSSVSGPVGSSTTGAPFLVSNVGNTPLTISGITFQNTSVFNANSSSTCTNGTVLQAGSVCNIVPNFTPPQAQQYSVPVTFNTNNGTNSNYTLYGQGTTAVNLTATPNPVNVGQPVTLTVTVSAGGTAFPTGTVSFVSYGMGTIGSATLSPTSTPGVSSASYMTSSLAAGVYTLTANYGGDTNTPAGMSSPLTLVVANQGTTTLSLSSSSVPLGQTLTLTATVVGATSATPTGTVQFFNGPTVLGSATLAPAAAAATASAVFSTSALTPTGTYILTAKYLGDANNPASTSPPQNVVVTQASTTTAISVSATQLSSNQSETLTATITGLPSPSLTGSVGFYDGDSYLGQGTVTSTANGGTATLTLSNLTAGSHAFTATYNGDQNYGVSSSGTAVVTVTQAVVVSSQSFGSVAVGASASMPVTVGGSGSLVITDNPEFTPSSDPACTSSCTITIKFAPLYPGLRSAAITALDGNGNVLGKTYLYGTGTGPQFGFDPGMDTVLSGILQAPSAIAIGSNGSVYVADAGTAQVYVSVNGGTPTALPIQGLNSPGGLAVAGDNTVYVADQPTGTVISYNPSTQVQGTVQTTPLNDPGGLAVDGTGALYISDNGNGRIIKIDNQGNETSVATGLNSPQGIAVDASSNLYYADLGSAGEIVELPAGGGAAVAKATELGASLRGVGLDAAGRIYFTSDSGLTLLATNGTTSNFPLPGLTGAIYGVALAGNGDVWVAQPNPGLIVHSVRGTASTTLQGPAGVTTQQGPDVVSNTGNSALTLSGLAFAGSTSIFAVDPASNCAAGVTLQPGMTCSTFVDFDPPSAQQFTGALAYTSNSLNANGATDVDTLYGQGTSPSTNPTTTTLAASPNPVVGGQTVTLTATVTGSGNVTPTGTVTFYDGTTMLGMGTLSAASTPATARASFATAALTVGTHTVSASYAGDANDSASSGSTSLVVSAPGAARSSIVFSTSAGTPNAYERPVSLLATVTSAGAPVTNGQVIFCDTSAPHCNLTTNLGIAQLNSGGLATLRINPGLIGPHTYQAIFLGTTAYQAVSSDSDSLTVGGIYPSVTTIIPSGSAGNYSLTANVSGIGALGYLATGTVSFIDTSNSNSVLGTASLGFFSTSFSEVQASGSPVATGRNPYGVAAGDVNGDGFVDLITENYGAGTVSVLLGNGDGTFLPAATYAVGGDPERVLIADFNGDGYPDLVVANTGSNTVGVLINNGDGTFKPQATYAASSPVGLGVMDLNHDGIADIVASDYYSNTVSVLLGNGDGTFKSAVTYGTGHTPQTMAEGDFNGDGNVDLVVGNLGDNNVAIYLGNGDGTFQSPVTYAVGSGPQGVQVGDFNKDGIADLAVSNSNDGTVSVLIGKGDGTFLPQVTYPVGSSPVGIAIADFNLDGNQDITVGNTAQSSLSQSILLGNGDGTFQPQMTYKTGNFPYGVAVGDFNGDGFPDLGISDFNDSTATILISQMSQTATATVTGIAPGGTAGTHQVDAVYAGNTNYSGSTSTTIPLTAGSGPTAMITGVSFTGSPANPTITITGSGFNPEPTGDNEPMSFFGQTGQDFGVNGLYLTDNGVFTAGQDGDAIGLVNLTYTDTLISFQFGSDYPAQFASALAEGDTYIVSVNGVTFSGTVHYPALASQTINFPSIPNHTYGDAPFMLNATASSGLPVSYTVVSGPATVSGSTVTLSGAGTVTIQANQAGNTTYAAATPVSQSFTVAQASQTITFPPIPNHTVGDAPFMLAATASSGLAVSYSVVSGPATIAGSTVTLTGAGTVTIQSTQPGNANYAAAAPVSQSFTVALSTQTITFPAIPAHTFGDAPFLLSATASSGLAVSYTVTSGPATVSGNTVTLTGVGTVTIQATQAGNTTYAAATPVSQSFTVAQASQTITFTAIPNHSVSDPPFTLNATASSGLAVSFAVTSGPATISGATVTLTGTGTVTIQATQAGNANYAAATPVSQSFTVALSTQTITFPAIPNHTFGDAPFALNATASSSLPVSYVVTSGPAAVSGNTVTITGVGVVVITASQAGNSSYGAATPVSQSFTVAQAAQTITFPAIPNHTVGDAPFALNATASSGLSVGYSIVSGPATLAGNMLTVTGAGTVVVSASQAGNANYAAATPVSQSFTVSLATQTITFPAIPNHVFGDAPFTLNASASSGLPVSYAVVSGPATVAGRTVTITGAGTVTLQATQAGNTTYAAAAPVSQRFSVSQASQTISFPAIPNHTAGDAPFTVNATASSGLTVTLAVASGPATIAGSTVTITGAGTVVIQATQAGNTNYAAATPVSQSFTVALQTQSITFPAIPNHTLGDPPFTLSATASSGLAVAYAVTSGPATVSGNTVTLTGTGTVAIQATQAGNGTYAAAAPVTQSFNVSPPPPALTSINPAGGVVGSGATTITLTGTNFAASDTVQLNGAALSTTFVSATTLTAVVPASFLAAAGTGQVTVFDSATNATTSAQPFAVLAAPAITFTGPATSGSATQPALTFQLVNPYPFAIAGSLTLTFTPSGSGGVDDPAVQFSTGGRTLLYTIPALSQVTPTVQIQSGTVAGVATVTLVVTSNGVNVTPANVAPVQITIPAAVPAITTATVTRAGTTLTVVVQGFSNTRDLATAIFHFTASSGSSVSTPDITAPVATVFANYFTSTASAAYGSTFVYTQNFTLNNDASSIQSVTVTLVNSVGQSVQVTSQ